MTREEQDQQLQQWVEEAQRHPPGSPARRRSLSQAIRIVLASKYLYRPPVIRLPLQCRGAYPDIYRDAQQSLILYVCQNIERYDPDKASFLSWINMLMDRRFIWVGVQQFQDKREQRLGKRRSLQELSQMGEDIPAPKHKDANHAEFRRLIIEDPTGLLKSQKLKKRPEITLQLLLMQRLEDKTWDEIAAEFDISLQTLHSFFRRSLKKLSPELRQYFDL